MAYGNILFPFNFQHLNKSKNTYHEKCLPDANFVFLEYAFSLLSSKPNFKFFWNLKTWNNLQCLRRAIPQKTKQSSWLRYISPSEPSKLHFWMGFGGSLAKDKPDHHIYIWVEICQQVGVCQHPGIMFSSLWKIQYTDRAASFLSGGLFLAPLFLLNYFLFNLFFILAKKCRAW